MLSATPGGLGVSGCGGNRYRYAIWFHPALDGRGLTMTRTILFAAVLLAASSAHAAVVSVPTSGSWSYSSTLQPGFSGISANGTNSSYLDASFHLTSLPPG